MRGGIILWRQMATSAVIRPGASNMTLEVLNGLSAEVKRQPEILQEFWRQGFPKARRGSIFVGAGDSFAAAQLGFFASDCRHIALDPYVLASNPRIAEGREVYFVSVSGRTRSNIQAARKVGPHAKQTTALTAVAHSPLAGLTDRQIALPMTYLPRTPGLLSFTLSAVAVLKISGAEGRCDFENALGEASDGDVAFAGGKGITYFLGNSLAYPVSLYAAAKAYEILGAKAQAELLEEFNHLELFSMDRSDLVNCFSCFDPSGLAPKLSGILDRRSLVIRQWGRLPIEKLFHAIFQVQLSVLGEAKRRGVTTPMFLSRHDSLAASDRMIY
jgi:D-arabinose 5-phosphate isomerase GutQ